MVDIENWDWKPEHRYVLNPIRKSLRGESATIKQLNSASTSVYSNLCSRLELYSAIEYHLPYLKLENNSTLALLKQKLLELKKEATEIQQYFNTFSSRGLNWKLTNPPNSGHSKADCDAAKQEVMAEMVKIKQYQENLEWYLTKGLALFETVEPHLQEHPDQKMKEYIENPKRALGIIIDNLKSITAQERVYTLQ